MPKYSVTVRYEMQRDLDIYADDREAAKDKAIEIVEDWNGVRIAEVKEVREE